MEVSYDTTSTHGLGGPQRAERSSEPIGVFVKQFQGSEKQAVADLLALRSSACAGKSCSLGRWQMADPDSRDQGQNQDHYHNQPLPGFDPITRNLYIVCKINVQILSRLPLRCYFDMNSIEFQAGLTEIGSQDRDREEPSTEGATNLHIGFRLSINTVQLLVLWFILV